MENNFVERLGIRAKLYSEIEEELVYAGDAAKIKTPPSEAEQKLIKVAGLAISALENLRANGQFAPRHYEEKVAKG